MGHTAHERISAESEKVQFLRPMIQIEANGTRINFLRFIIMIYSMSHIHYKMSGARHGYVCDHLFASVGTQFSDASHINQL